MSLINLNKQVNDDADSQASYEWIAGCNLTEALRYDIFT